MTSPFAGLPSAEQARAQALAATFRQLGADDPESWAVSEVRDGIPQLATYLLLRKMWAVTDGMEDAQAWVRGMAAAATEQPDGPFGDAGQALERLMAAGADAEDVVRVARMVAYGALFSAAHSVDEGMDPDAPEGTPGWVLVETDGEGTPTGRVIGGLHEELLSLAPGGNEGRPQ